MTTLIEKLESFEDFFGKEGCSRKAITEAEDALGLTFSKEYKSYLETFSLASANGHEFTGICDSPRLNVVDVTLKERAYQGDIDSQLYVVERVGVDDIVAWQDADGRIYTTIGQSTPEMVYDSLIELLSQ